LNAALLFYAIEKLSLKLPFTDTNCSDKEVAVMLNFATPHVDEVIQLL